MGEIDKIISSHLAQRQEIGAQVRQVQAEEIRRKAELLPEVIAATSKLIRISAKHNYPGALPIIGGHTPRGWQVLRQPFENEPHYIGNSLGILGEYKLGIRPSDSIIGIDGSFYDVRADRHGWDSIYSVLSEARPIYGFTIETRTVKTRFSARQETIHIKSPAIRPETIEAHKLQSMLFTIGRVVVQQGLEEDWRIGK